MYKIPLSCLLILCVIFFACTNKKRDFVKCINAKEIILINKLSDTDCRGKVTLNNPLILDSICSEMLDFKLLNNSKINVNHGFIEIRLVFQNKSDFEVFMIETAHSGTIFYFGRDILQNDSLKEIIKNQLCKKLLISN